MYVSMIEFLAEYGIEVFIVSLILFTALTVLIPGLGQHSGCDDKKLTDLIDTRFTDKGQTKEMIV